MTKVKIKPGSHGYMTQLAHQDAQGDFHNVLKLTYQGHLKFASENG